MVLTSRVIELREWDKRGGIMIYGSFCMLQHLKWWFKPEQMIWQGPGVVQGGAKIRQNQSKSMVLTRLKIRIGEGVKRNGIIIYAYFCMLRHLKWWFKPEQMIWQGPGVVQGGAKIRQNQSKSMVLTRLKIRIGERVKGMGSWYMDLFACFNT